MACRCLDPTPGRGRQGRAQQVGCLAPLPSGCVWRTHKYPLGKAEGSSAPTPPPPPSLNDLGWYKKTRYRADRLPLATAAPQHRRWVTVQG